tara:strand:+ start:648 stop:1328 length:681 start_codon:yes stop_codon:yes gene_type:complete
MRSFYFFILFFVLCSCTSEGSNYSHPYAKYFYDYNTEPKVYRYRDIIHGLNEQFHRVYGVEDSEGKHIVVERYVQDGRLTEAFNFNLDSLNVMDHMVVNALGENEKATLYKDLFFPKSKNEVVQFTSKFSGISDSTVFLMEVNRTLGDIKMRQVLSDSSECIKLVENATYTLLNPFTKQESPQTLETVAYYAQDVGLIEWYDTQRRSHFQLEDILSQEKWIKLISK